MSKKYPVFVKYDLDGFFGIFIDNLVQLLLIVALCTTCGISADSDLLLKFILPGAALSIFFGNIFYAWLAHRVAHQEGRSDVTALPYGINTPSLLVYIFFVMIPVYQQTKDPVKAWQMGVIACLGSGLIEFFGSFIAEKIRRKTPRAALLSTLAGIAIGFISMSFALQIYQRPLVAMVPLAIVLLTYFAQVRFPLGIPGGLIAVFIGTVSAWLFPYILPENIAGPAMKIEAVRSSIQNAGWYMPQFVGSTILKVLSQPQQWIGYLSVIIPMGLFNVIGSLQNIESAEASGDRYPTGISLGANGLGTIIAALFGSCFPTTIYIGHPGWKSLGARAGYSTLNGFVILLICLTGTVGLISSVIPIEAGVAIVLWIGIIITAQAFQATPKKHAPAVAIGLFPAIAAWGFTVVQGTFILIGFSSEKAATLQQILSTNVSTQVSGFLIHGMIAIERGYIFTCLILSAICAFLIDQKFYSAAIWSLVASIFAWIGLSHSYQLNGNNVDYLFRFQSVPEGTYAFHASGISLGYFFCFLIFLYFGYANSKGEGLEKIKHE